MQRPPALNPGDTIAIVLPATPVSKRAMQEVARQIRGKGYQVVQYGGAHCYGKHYLSDTDENRADYLNRAFANPSVKAIFPLNGGGGTFRPTFLEHLDWELIRRNPKIVTGYSDITFLHHALHAKANLVTFHSPFPGEHPKQSVSQKAFWKMLSPRNPSLPPAPICAGSKYRCLVPGEATGTIVGGNLSLLAATIGTPYQVDLTDKILFLEDWRENFETIDRLFAQLVHHGLWHQIKGLILGEFVQVPLTPPRYKLPLERFIRDITKEAKKHEIPVGYHFPIGHGTCNRTIPLGIKAHFNSKNGILRFLESPLCSDSHG